MPNRCKDIENWQGKHWQSKAGEIGAAFAEKCGAAADVSNTGRKHRIGRKLPEQSSLCREMRCSVAMWAYQTPIEKSTG